MRIVLVHPTGYNWVPGKKDITPIANRMAPLGLLSLAAYLEARGHRVFVYDCLGPDTGGSNERHVQQIMAFKPDLVGFSVTTSGFLDGYDLAKRIRGMASRVLNVFGGVHVSAMGAELMRRFDQIDYMCMGEGEQTLAELADGAAPGTIDGLVWRDSGQPVTNPPRSPIEELDDLPFPAYEKLDGFPRGYNLPLFSYIMTPGATMVTSRGCPFQCSYCDRSVFKRGFRYNSADYIYDHMRHLRTRLGVRHINIYDDLFTSNRSRIEALCRKLIDMPLGIQFNCAVRVGHADEELLRMLHQAGCLMVSVGIETGNTDLMAVHKPGVEIEQIKRTVRRIQKAGLRAKGLFMMGLPGETEAAIRQTSDLCLALDLDDMNMSKFTPFFGAPVWATIRQEGVLEEDWRRMNCLNFVFVPRTIDSVETLEQLYNAHVKRFYSSPSWRRKFRSRLWQHRHSLWHLLRHLPSFWAAKRHFEPDA